MGETEDAFDLMVGYGHEVIRTRDYKGYPVTG